MNFLSASKSYYANETLWWSVKLDFPERHPLHQFYRKYNSSRTHYQVLAVGHPLKECKNPCQNFPFRHCKCAHYTRIKPNKIDVKGGASENKPIHFDQNGDSKMNSKLTKVNPQQTTGSYIQGTTASNYFLIASDSWKGIVAFRPVSMAIPSLGTTPKAGQETRVRVVPSNDTSNLARLMDKFGFNRTSDSKGVHYSKVTTNAPEAVADANLALQIAA